jgi:hypothetical protein
MPTCIREEYQVANTVPNTGNEDLVHSRCGTVFTASLYLANGYGCLHGLQVQTNFWLCFKLSDLNGE